MNRYKNKYSFIWFDCFVATGCDGSGTTGRTVYSSCKEIRDSNHSSASGEYTIRTSTGRILDKVNQLPDYAKMLVSAIRPHNFFVRLFHAPLTATHGGNCSLLPRLSYTTV